MTQPTRSGDFNRLVLVQKPQDAGGQDAGICWKDVKPVYAKIESLSGRELLAAQQIQSEISHRFTLHYDPVFDDPKAVATWRVAYGKRVFDIKACMNIDEENRVIELLANEGLNQG